MPRLNCRAVRFAVLAVIILLCAARSEAMNITLQWNASPASENIFGYTVYVGTSPGTYTQAFNVTSGTTYTWTGASPYVVYYFAVAAYNGAGEGPKSTEIVSFTDYPLTAGTTVVKAAHIAELRTRINAARALHGLAAWAWTDTTLTAGANIVRAVHVTEMRTALAQVYTSVGRAVPTYTNQTLTPGASVIKAVDITELRTALMNLQ